MSFGVASFSMSITFSRDGGWTPAESPRNASAALCNTSPRSAKSMTTGQPAALMFSSISSKTPSAGAPARTSDTAYGQPPLTLAAAIGSVTPTCCLPRVVTRTPSSSAALACSRTSLHVADMSRCFESAIICPWMVLKNASASSLARAAAAASSAALASAAAAAAAEAMASSTTSAASVPTCSTLSRSE